MLMSYLPLIVDLLLLAIALVVVVAGVRLLWIAGTYLKKKGNSPP